MERTIKFHQPADLDKATLEAFTWVKETGGTLLFMLPRDKKRATDYLKKNYNRVSETIEPGDVKDIHIELTHGGVFTLFGPRVAAVSIDELGMSRIEHEIESKSVELPIEELRSYARNPDKHPEWTKKYSQVF